MATLSGHLCEKLSPALPRPSPSARGTDRVRSCPQVVLSDREKELALALRSTGLLMKAIPADDAAGGFFPLC